MYCRSCGWVQVCVWSRTETTYRLICAGAVCISGQFFYGRVDMKGHLAPLSSTPCFHSIQTISIPIQSSYVPSDIPSISKRCMFSCLTSHFSNYKPFQYILIRSLISRMHPGAPSAYCCIVEIRESRPLVHASFDISACTPWPVLLKFA